MLSAIGHVKVVVVVSFYDKIKVLSYYCTLHTLRWIVSSYLVVQCLVSPIAKFNLKRVMPLAQISCLDIKCGQWIRYGRVDP